MQTIARLVFKDGEVFRPDEYIYTGQKSGIDARRISKLTGFITVKDPTVETIETPNGKVEFLEFIGMTDAELKTLSTLATVRDIYKSLVLTLLTTAGNLLCNGKTLQNRMIFFC